MTKKILVISIGGLGDQILFLPCLKEIKRQNPDSEITFLVDERAGLPHNSIKDLTPLIDNLICWGNIVSAKSKLLNLLKLAINIVNNRYDIIINHSASKFLPVILLFARVIGIRKIIGYDKYNLRLKNLLYTDIKPLNEEQYAVYKYLDLVCDNPSEYKFPEIYIPEKDQEWAKSFISKELKTIVVHPGISIASVKRNLIKNLSPETYAQIIIELLKGEEYQVIMTGGKDDLIVADRIKSELEKQIIDSRFINLCEKTNRITKLAALIKDCDLLICNDSAPLHLGVALNKKVIAIFGPTNYKRYVPLNNQNITIIRNNLLYCSPCLFTDDVSKKRTATCQNPLCLNIPPETIVNEVFSCLKKTVCV